MRFDRFPRIKHVQIAVVFVKLDCLTDGCISHRPGFPYDRHYLSHERQTVPQLIYVYINRLLLQQQGISVPVPSNRSTE